MTNELFVKIVSAVITIIVALVSAYVIPAIKAHITQKDMETIIKYVKIAIMCADQIFTPEQWEEKKEWVKEYIVKVVDEKLHIKLTDADIEAIIEAFVHELHHLGAGEKYENI